MPTRTINHLTLSKQHSNAQLAFWLQQSHETSREIHIPLTRAIPTSSGVHRCIHMTHKSTITRVYIRQAPTNILPVASSLTKHRPIEHCIYGPDAYPIHLRARRHAQAQGFVGAQRSCNVDISWPLDCPTILRRLGPGLSEEATQRMTHTADSISQSYGQIVTTIAPFVYRLDS